MRAKVLLVTLFVLGVLISSEHKAQAVLVTLTSGQSATFLYDGATSSPSCTLCDASVTLTFNGTSLNIAFSNTSSDGTAPSPVNILTSFAFDTTPNLTFSNPQFSNLPAGKSWSFQTTGLGSFEFGSTSDQGINGGLDAGESGNLTVDISSPPSVTSLAIDLTETHFQAINALGGTSTKPEGCVSGTPDCGGTPGGPGAATTAIGVPEPSALVLFGVGLLAFVRRVRSKRN